MDRGGEQGDARAGELVGNCAEDGLGVAGPEFSEEHERLEVGPEVEEVAGVNLAGHDGFAHAFVFEIGNHAAELADAHPLDVVHQGGKPRVGLGGEGGGDDLPDAGGPRLASEDERVGIVAGDET